MIIKIRNTVNFAQIANATLRDFRLSLDTKGLLCLILSFPDDARLSVDYILSVVNKNRDKKCHIGVKALRRMTKELTDAGYLEIKAIRNEETKSFAGKEWNIYGQSSKPAENFPENPENTGILAESALTAHTASEDTPLTARTNKINDFDVNNTHTLKEKNKKESSDLSAAMAAGTAARILSECFDVTLKVEEAEWINGVVPQDEIEEWKMKCKSRTLRWTDEESVSYAFRKGAIDYQVTDFRTYLAKKAERELKRKAKESIAGSASIAGRDVDQPKQPRSSGSGAGIPERVRLSFGERADEGLNLFGWTEEQYINYRDSHIAKYKERGNDKGLKEIEDYETIRARRLANRQTSEGARP